MPWVVVKTKPRCERKARDNVENQGLETYLPILRERVKSSTGVNVRLSPLFPSYLFVCVVDSWRFLLNTIGVSSLIMGGPDDGPAVVRDKAMHQLMSRTDANGFIELPDRPDFVRGQPVKVTRGKFEGWEGLYHGSTSREREIVLLSIFGRQTRVSVGSGSLVAA